MEKAKTSYKQAKHERKAKIKDTYKDINKNASVKEKIMYNNATRKKAAMYVVDNNMSVDQAKKRANKLALRNTAVLFGAYGSITVANLYAMNR